MAPPLAKSSRAEPMHSKPIADLLSPGATADAKRSTTKQHVFCPEQRDKSTSKRKTVPNTNRKDKSSRHRARPDGLTSTRLPLLRHSYTPSRLASHLRTFLSLPSADRPFELPTAELQFRRWFEEWPEQAGKQPFKDFAVPSGSYIYQGLEHISNIFFGGDLHHCQFFWQENLSYKENITKQTRPAFGVSWSLPKGGEHWSIIIMDPADFHAKEEGSTLATGKLGTLLHECIHAYFSIYGTYVWNLKPHGDHFIMVATYIEALAAQILGVPIELGIKQEVIRDYISSGVFMTVDFIVSCHPGWQDRLQSLARFANTLESKVQEFQWKEHQKGHIIDSSTLQKLRSDGFFDFKERDAAEVKKVQGQQAGEQHDSMMED